MIYSNRISVLYKACHYGHELHVVYSALFDRYPKCKDIIEINIIDFFFGGRLL